MMPNVTRGSKTVGLMVYLVGGGRSNEHSEPHLVAGDPTVTAWLGDDELDRNAAVGIGRDLEQPARVHGVEVAQGHVWHCSLSLHEREGLLSDEKWSQIAQELVDEMGFSHREQDGEVLRSGCRWVAVRHGRSTGGNDHIHVVVSLVREDGTKANVWQDRPRVQKICGLLEAKYGLEVLDSRQAERGGRGEKPAEREIAQREGRPEAATAVLARTVRACATAALDEAEFVRLLRGEKLWVRPRFAAGRSDVVSGYSVALQPAKGTPAVWYGGGRLGKDLTLPQLRKSWPSSPQAAGAAVGEWSAAMGRAEQPPAAAPEIDAATWQQAEAELVELCQQLRDVPLEEGSTWAHAARDASGVFAAWSLRVERRPGALACASDVLARSAQVRSRDLHHRPARMPSSRTAARAMRFAETGGHGAAAEALLFRQVSATMRAVYDMHQARGDAQTAANIARMVRDELRPFETALQQASVPDEARDALRVAQAGQVPLRTVLGSDGWQGEGQQEPRPAGRVNEPPEPEQGR